VDAAVEGLWAKPQSVLAMTFFAAEQLGQARDAFGDQFQDARPRGPRG